MLFTIFCMVVLGAAAANATNYNVTVTLKGTSTGTITSSPAGISCKPTCSGSFTAGTQVQLTAKAGSGAFFAGWSGACKGTAHTCTLTVNSNLAVTATFKDRKSTRLNSSH